MTIRAVCSWARLTTSNGNFAPANCRTDSQEAKVQIAQPSIGGNMRNEAAPCESTEPLSVGRTGLERVDVTSRESRDLANPANSGGAESGAHSAKKNPKAPDLAKVVRAWPELPEAVRVGILAMVKVSLTE